MEQKKLNATKRRSPKVKTFAFNADKVVTGEADEIVNGFSDTHKVTVIQFERDQHLFIYRILYFE